MVRKSLRAFGALLAIAATAVSAAAAPLPPEVKAVLDEKARECREAEGRGLKGNGLQAVRRLDLNGDGRPDFIVDFDKAPCVGIESLFCGTGGCTIVILASRRDGTLAKVLDRNVHRYQVLGGKGPRRIRFDLHGSLCGKFGPEPCVKTRTIIGKPISLED
ncbi:MAG TPA: hypothetical protein VF744_21035 [Beijerinckiaceae bacterium]|jgi:hypothetical protein